MKKIRFRGSVADQSLAIHGRTEPRFALIPRVPSRTPGHPLGMAPVLSRAFNGFLKQRRTRLGGKNRSIRDEAAGRLEQIVAKGGGRPKYDRNNRRKHRTLEMIVSQRGLPPRRAR